LRLQAILDEIEFNKSEVFNQSSTQRAGKLLGAKQILKGSFIISQDNELTLNLTVIDVKTGTANLAISKTGRLSEYYRMEKELTIFMIDSMGIKITDEVRQKILTIPTEGFFDFVERMKKKQDEEKIEVPAATATIEAAVTPSTTITTDRLGTMDANTGSETIESRTDVPSRFLADPPLPPK
jgi:hypothetical protein